MRKSTSERFSQIHEAMAAYITVVEHEQDLKPEEAVEFLFSELNKLLDRWHEEDSSSTPDEHDMEF